MKITKRQLKRIIKEEYKKIMKESRPGVDSVSPTARNFRAKAEQGMPAPIRGEDESDWIIWAEQYSPDISPEYDNEGQLHFYLPEWTDMSDPVAKGIVEEAEDMGASVEILQSGQIVIYTGEYE